MKMGKTEKVLGLFSAISLDESAGGDLILWRVGIGKKIACYRINCGKGANLRAGARIKLSFEACLKETELFATAARREGSKIMVKAEINEKPVDEYYWGHMLLEIYRRTAETRRDYYAERRALHRRHTDVDHVLAQELIDNPEDAFLRQQYEQRLAQKAQAEARAAAKATVRTNKLLANIGIASTPAPVAVPDNLTPITTSSGRVISPAEQAQVNAMIQEEEQIYDLDKAPQSFNEIKPTDPEAVKRRELMRQAVLKGLKAAETPAQRKAREDKDYQDCMNIAKLGKKD